MNSFIIAGIVGPWQLVIVVVLALLLFGGKKLPELMRGLGQGMQEFKKATRGDYDETSEQEKKIEK